MRSLPTYANLKRFLRERFQQPFLEMGDNFWFFFAGHGELHEGHDYLMPIDADPGNVEETALRIGDITAYLRNSGADNVILLLDACRSQGKRGQGFGSEEQAGMVTIYSCSPREASYEIDELQHGSFTYALLEGLHLKGVQNCATVERLDQYLRYQVPDLNQRHGKPRQTPYTAVEPISTNHLILLPHQSTLLADVQALKNAAFEAETEQNSLLAEQLWIRVLAVYPADQQAIKAIKRLALLGVAEVPNVMGQAPLPESTNGADDSEDPQIRAIRRQHELDVLKTNLEIKRIDADFFKAQQEHEFESRLIDAELQGFIKARQGKPPQPKRTKKSFPPPVIQVFKFDVVTVNEQGREISRQQGQAQFYLEDLGAGVQLEMVAIPDGTFAWDLRILN